MSEINVRGWRLASGVVAIRRAKACTTAMVAVVAALVVSAPDVAAQPSERDLALRRSQLPNGLEVIIAPSGGVPLVTIELVVRNGAFTQPPEYAGLAHLFEHMFFKANDDYPEPHAFMDRAARLGAVFNATTREEQVTYYLTVAADSLEGGLRFLASALRGAQFRADELAREKVVVLGEYDRAESSPFFRFDQQMGRMLWGDFWSRKNTIGDRAVISGVTPDQMKAIRDLYYLPNNSALIVSGAVDPDATLALVRTVLGDWPRGADPFVRAPVPAVAPLTISALLFGT
ncbi:MAG: M16 family metallopeptidase [Gemmatimonadota bacterium]